MHCRSGKYSVEKATLLIVLFSFFSGISYGQAMDEHMQMHGDTMNMQAESMQMTSSFSLSLPANRDGSGTSWQPDESPMNMYMKMYPKTTLMFHGSVFIRYTWQDANNKYDRGGQKFDAPNWMMFMLQQKLSSKDLFSFHLMLSLDRLTEGGTGYPLLFQTGESFDSIPLVDRQHPHDLFSELAVSYTHSFTKDIDFSAYFGYPGEPALGPGAFMHRASAMNNPDAPLGHHWQDASHITFGVGTIGFRYNWMKAEGSIFTGREPDENRYNFDKPRFDSYSYRISINPGKSLSLQFSQGFIKSPEALEPGINIVRTTSSIQYNKLFSHDKFIASTLIWGMNHSSEGKNLHSILFESNVKLAPLTLYSRYEFVQKDAHELQLEQFSGNPTFNINAVSLGLSRILFSQFRTDVSVGLQGSIYFPGGRLESVYGNYPLAGEIYLKIAPALNHH
jgi:hypothetical protein